MWKDIYITQACMYTHKILRPDIYYSLYIEGHSSYNRFIFVFARATVPVLFFDNGRRACVFRIGKLGVSAVVRYESRGVCVCRNVHSRQFTANRISHLSFLQPVHFLYLLARQCRIYQLSFSTMAGVCVCS